MWSNDWLNVYNKTKHNKKTFLSMVYGNSKQTNNNKNLIREQREEEKKKMLLRVTERSIAQTMHILSMQFENAESSRIDSFI